MTIIGYLDPGTGTLIVQAVLGGAAGAAVLFKTKGRKLFKKGKETEAAQAEASPTTADEGAPAPTASAE